MNGYPLSDELVGKYVVDKRPGDAFYKSGETPLKGLFNNAGGWRQRCGGWEPKVKTIIVTNMFAPSLGVVQTILKD